MARLVIRAGTLMIQVLLCISEAFLSMLLTVIFVPILLLIFTLNEILRGILNQIIFPFRSSEKVSLIKDGCDAVWSYKKGGNARMIVSILVYENKFDLKEYMDKFASHIIEYKTPSGERPYHRLKRIFTRRLGYWVWKECPNFSLENHISILEGGPRTEEELLRGLATEWSNDMDEVKPQWEQILVPRLIYKDRGTGEIQEKSAVVFRFHHSFMDGGSTLLMFGNTMYDEVKDGSFPYCVDPMKKFNIPAWKKGLYYGKCVLYAATTIFRSVYEASTLTSEFLVPGPYSGSRTYAWGEPISVETLRRIRNISGFSVQTILASVTASSLASLTRKEVRDETVVGFVAALIPYPDIKPRNYFTVVNFGLNTSPETVTTPLERLLSTKRSLDILLQSPDLMVNYCLFKFFGRFPSFVTQGLMNSARTPIIFSNAPWSTRRVKLWENEVLEISAWMPLLTSAGLGMSCVRYDQSVRFCVVADDAGVKEEDLRIFMDAVHEGVKGLDEECSALEIKDKCNNNILPDIKNDIKLDMASIP